MKVLKWCGRHKIWAFLIVAFVCIVATSIFSKTGDDIAYGKAWGTLFIFYLLVIWIYGAVKRHIQKKGRKVDNG